MLGPAGCARGSCTGRASDRLGAVKGGRERGAGTLGAPSCVEAVLVDLSRDFLSCVCFSSVCLAALSVGFSAAFGLPLVVLLVSCLAPFLAPALVPALLP